MKRFTKIMAVLLAVIMLAGTLYGCKSEPQPEAEIEPDSQPVDEVVEDDIPQFDGYHVLWHDEFDGTELNLDNWSYEKHPAGWTNSELQRYTDSTDNIFIRDGKLVIKAIQTPSESGTGYQYTSGKLNTRGNHDFTYGKIVVSAKVPEGQGLWPAIWMMPRLETHYGMWPICGEMDIMEILGSQPNVTYSTIHYGTPHAQKQGTYALKSGSFADGFHEFALDWEPGELRFYTDGELVLTVNDWFSSTGAKQYPYPAPFDQDFCLQLNLAVGGTWPGNPDETTDFSKAEFEVDYVRVYQKESYDTNVTRPEKEFREALEDGNMIYNGDFANAENLTDDTDWKFMLMNGGAGAAEIKDGMLVITTEKEGTVDYSLQLVQADLGLIKGHTYRVSFDARAEAPRTMIVCVSAPTVGYIRYMQDTTVDLTTDWKTYTYEFEMTFKDDNCSRIEYNMGRAGSTAEINLTNVRIDDITE